jgi:formylmethanofuran dehydrogenase subunit E
MQGALFNKLSINKAAVIKSWANFIIQKEGYGKTPYFVYTKGSKKTNEIKVKKSNNLDKELIKEYCKRYHINLKDFNNLLNLYNSELIDDVNRYEKIISIKEQEKKISK